MRFPNIAPLAAAAMLSLASLSTHAALSSYSQNFESLVATSGSALSGDGWKVFANVYNPDTTVAYSYGPFNAPNGTPGFSSVATGQGGPAQGNQQLVVYSDYNNGDQANGLRIEANVFRQQTIAAADAGTTWVFEFDAKHGDLVPNSTAFAFLKTLDPLSGFATTNFLQIETTSISADWNHYSVSLPIIAALSGQLIQYGFSATATAYTASGTFYDNVSFAPVTAVPEPEAFTMLLMGLGMIGFMVRRRASPHA